MGWQSPDIAGGTAMIPEISGNQIAQFAARFEPHGDGYVYYASAQHGGVPLSADERDYFIAHYVTKLSQSMRVMKGWAIIAGIGLAIADIAYGVVLAEWQMAMIILLPCPWGIGSWWRARQLVYQRIGTRAEVTHARSYYDGVRSRVRAFPTGMVLLMLAVGVGLLIQLYRYGQLASDVSGTVIGIGVILFALWILWIKRH